MRLVARADWDGLVCAVLLSTIERIDIIHFTDPKEIQDDSADIPVDSIIANLPYHRNCAMWFDHHISEPGQSRFELGREQTCGDGPRPKAGQVGRNTCGVRVRRDRRCDRRRRVCALEI